MRNYPQRAREKLVEFLERMENLEQKEMELLASKWGVISASLEGLILKLAEKEFLTENQLFQSQLYKQFLKESEQKVALYNKYATGVIVENQEKFAKFGLDSSQEIIGIQVSLFKKLPESAINVMIGKTQDGSPLDVILNKSYSGYVEQIKNQLITSVALGKNPRETARLLSKESNIPLWKSLRLARTEQMYCFRESSKLQMKESGVVKEWERIEQYDACDDCAEVNGKRYSLDVGFDSHPNCRGAMLPIVG